MPWREAWFSVAGDRSRNLQLIHEGKSHLIYSMNFFVFIYPENYSCKITVNKFYLAILIAIQNHLT